MWDRTTRHAQAGFILITLYMLLMIMITLGGILMAHAVAETQAAQRTQASLQAFYLAEGGVDWAIAQLRQDTTWAGGNGTGTTGTYSAAIAALAGNRRRITGQGTATQGITATRSIESIVLLTPNPLFRYATFGTTSVTLNGEGLIDSYDSSQGAYSPATASAHGDVGTNGAAAGNVSLHGDMRVNGNAYSGPGSNPNVVVTMTSTDVITGNKLAMPKPEPMAPVTVPGGTNLGVLTVSGDTTLPGGTYTYQNISVTGNGRLTFTGPTTLYVTGTLNIAGHGVSTASNLPPNLLIYVAGAGAVSLGGQSFYGGVYAPQSAVTIQDHIALYGSVMGTAVTTSGNIDLHYDLALQNSSGAGSATVQMLSWQDLS